MYTSPVPSGCLSHPDACRTSFNGRAPLTSTIVPCVLSLSCIPLPAAEFTNPCALPLLPYGLESYIPRNQVISSANSLWVKPLPAPIFMRLCSPAGPRQHPPLRVCTGCPSLQHTQFTVSWPCSQATKAPAKSESSRPLQQSQPPFLFRTEKDRTRWILRTRDYLTLFWFLQGQWFGVLYI